MIAARALLAGLVASALLTGCDEPAGKEKRYVIGGQVSGLTGSGLKLRLDVGGTLNIDGNGPFVFPDQQKPGTDYVVSVVEQPHSPDQVCTVEHASGTANADVVDILVNCVVPTVTPPTAPTPSVSSSGDIKTLTFSWPAAANATYYRLLESFDGGVNYRLAADNIVGMSYDYYAPLHLLADARFEIDSCNAGGCRTSEPLLAGNAVHQVIGYFRPIDPSPGWVGYGANSALSGDGKSLAIATYGDSYGAGIYYDPEIYPFMRVAYIDMFRLIDGHWVTDGTVRQHNGDFHDGFGGSLALDYDGDTLLVGAYAEESSAGGIDPADSNDYLQAGAAYVFTRTGEGWSQQAFIKSPSPVAGGFFGRAVDLSSDGNTAVVGSNAEYRVVNGLSAIPDYASNPYAGAIHVYKRAAGTWTLETALRPSSWSAADHCSRNLALSANGDRIVVGCSMDDGDGVDAGAIYVFDRQEGIWQEPDRIAAPLPAHPYFGGFLALSANGNVIVTADRAGNGRDNTVHVFRRDGGGWQRELSLDSNPDNSYQSNFGTDMALSADGNLLAVGDRDGSDGMVTRSGSVTLYRHRSGAWDPVRVITPPFPRTSQLFGENLDMSDDGQTLIVQALHDAGTVEGMHRVGGINPDDVTDVTFSGEERPEGAVYLY